MTTRKGFLNIRRCGQCHIRWQQPKHNGLCRRCAITAGLVIPTTLVREMRHHAAKQAHIEALRVVAPRPIAPTTTNTDRYDVVWNGTGSLFPPDELNSGLGRTLSGYSFSVRR